MAGIFIMFAVAAVIVLLQTSVLGNRAAARLAFLNLFLQHFILPDVLNR